MWPTGKFQEKEVNQFILYMLNVGLLWQETNCKFPYW